ncbi:unnamed protein product, partial [Polarella glacialis]
PAEVQELVRLLGHLANADPAGGPREEVKATKPLTASAPATSFYTALRRPVDPNLLVEGSESLAAVTTSMPLRADQDPEVFAACKALTLQGAQQVLAILRGHKLSENRSWRIPVGWYAIHCGAQIISSERAERMRQVWPEAPPEESLPHGAIMGLFYVQCHKSVEECRPDYVWARGPICHIVSKAVELPRPIRCGGKQGLWDLE